MDRDQTIKKIREAISTLGLDYEAAIEYIAQDMGIGYLDAPELLELAANHAGDTKSRELYNAEALHSMNAETVFVAIREIDARAIETVITMEAIPGAVAIGLNRTSNAKTLLAELDLGITRTVVLTLDAAHSAAARKILREGLQQFNVPFVCADISSGYATPQEAFEKDRSHFFEDVKAAYERTARPDNTTDYITNFIVEDIAAFKSNRVKTGFDNLDEKGGGLYPGLYVLAATSSLGKTTFALQLADQIAERGNDVVFFSLEQSRLELVTKSLARITSELHPDKSLTSLSIRRGAITDPIAQEAYSEYVRRIGNRITIVEGNFNCTSAHVGRYLKRYIERTGARPVVFVDYLQILRPEQNDKRGGTKENVDDIITEMKRISRDLNITIVLISSVNRASYLFPISFESLKETGSIEYTADVVWGLQLQCMHDELFSQEKKIVERREKIDEEQARNPRRIEIHCLKNRYGIKDYRCFFNYYPANDLYSEREELEYALPQTSKTGRKF